MRYTGGGICRDYVMIDPISLLQRRTVECHTIVQMMEYFSMNYILSNTYMYNLFKTFSAINYI